MGVNKVVFGAVSIIDISDSTVTSETVAEGETAYGANGEKFVGTMKAGGDPVQSDWLQNDTTAPDYIKNKPFGGVSNSISWASAGIAPPSVDEYSGWVKLSGAIVTEEDLASVTEGDPFVSWVTFYDGNISNIYDYTAVGWSVGDFHEDGNGIIGISIVDDDGIIFDGVQFRPDGVYFNAWASGVSALPLSITIPNFGKFETHKPIDSKYLPEGLQTETISLTDKIVITPIVDDNGNFDASKVISQTWLGLARKVSDAYIPVESCQMSGGWYTLALGTDEWGSSYVLYAEKVEDGFYKIHVTDEYGNGQESGYCVTDSHKYDTGLYLYDYYGFEYTFYCGAVFESRTPKPIDKKYLPDNIGMPEVTAEDEGKFLRVVDGAWAAVALPIYNGEVEDV